MTYTLLLPDRVPAGTSAPLRVTLTWDGDPLLAGDLATLTMSLFDRLSGAVINSHYEEDVLNLLVGDSLEYEFTDDDNVLVNSDLHSEEHCVLFTATWTALERRALWLIQYTVEALPAPVVPAGP